MKDVIGSADMTQGSLTSANSALALNGGWTQLPQGIYFDSSEFSISVWINPSNVGSCSRIIDFGNGMWPDNVIFSLSDSTSLKPYFEFYSESVKIFKMTSSKPITENQWQFLTATYNGTNARIYLNGTIVAELNIQGYIRPFNIWRSNCFIGKSAWDGDGNSHSYLDDLRFYNKSLIKEEIIELMNYNQNKTSFFILMFVSFKTKEK
jgi:hypothetical protein